MLRGIEKTASIKSNVGEVSIDRNRGDRPGDSSETIAGQSRLNACPEENSNAGRERIDLKQNYIHNSILWIPLVPKSTCRRYNPSLSQVKLQAAIRIIYNIIYMERLVATVHQSISFK